MTTRKSSSTKRKIAETAMGVAVGAAIAGPVGAVAGALVANQVSHIFHRARTDSESRGAGFAMDDPLIHANLRRILVPLDFSKPSLQSLRFAREWAARFGSEIVLLHVLEPTGTFVAFESDPFTPPIPAPNSHAHARVELEKLAREQLPKSTRVQMLVRDGVPHDMIAAVARELSCDLIIIATHGHKGLSRAVLGSTSERVVRHAPCPVLTLRRAS